MTLQTIDAPPCLINGQAAAVVSVRDRGLAYGDGVFRTLKCEAGRLLAWRAHYAKLQADCAALALVCPAETDWLADLARLAPHNAAIKLMVTRGESARGYAADPNASVTRISQLSPLPVYAGDLYIAGATIRLCDWRLSTHARLAGIKHLNRLDQVMARREWHDAGIFDGIMLNERNEVVEGVMSNLFVLHGNRLLTHPLTDCGVAGVMRSLVLNLAEALGMRAELRAFGVDELRQADALMLCNSLAGIVPVARLGDWTWQDFGAAQALSAALKNNVLVESKSCKPD